MIGKIKHYLHGMTSVFPIYPPPARFTEKDLPSFQDDAKALAGDWQRVGNYIRYAMGQHAQGENAQTLPHNQEKNAQILQEDLATLLEQCQSSVRQRTTD